MITPLEQFKIKKILDLTLFGYDISITNSTIFMMLSTICILIYYFIALHSKRILPDRLQMSCEIMHDMISNMLKKNVGEDSRKFFPLIFTIFIFIMTCNILGMMPYSFNVTSHISITFAIAMIIFVFITCLGIYLHGLRFFSLFLPKGTPYWLAPLMIIIELFAYLARPISLSLRLTSNMIAGHVLLKVIAGFAVSIVIYLKIAPLVFIVILTGFEIFVAILQAYIFSILSCVYLNDAINLH